MSTQDLAPWILTFLLHSTLLGGAALLAARSLKNPAAKAWVLRGGLLGALLTASFASWLGQGAQLHLPEVALSQNTTVIGLQGNPNGVEADQAQAQPVTGQAQAIPMQALLPGQSAQATPGLLTHWPKLLLLAAAAGLLRLARREWRARRTLAGRETSADPALLERARELTGDPDLLRGLRISTCAKLSSPLALGLSEVVLPLRAAELTSGERDALLAHELAHLVRRDPMWLGLGRVLTSLFWFQPLHALLLRELEDQTELAADAWAADRTGAPLELARSLERVGTWLTTEYAPATTAAMARRGSALLERVECLLDSERATALRPALGTAAVTGLALAVFACAGPAVQEAEQAKIIRNTDLAEELEGSPVVISLRMVPTSHGPDLIAYTIQGQRASNMETLGRTLQKLYGMDSSRVIQVQAQTGIRYEDVIPVLDSIIAAGFTNVRFAAEGDDEIISTSVGKTQVWVDKYEMAARIDHLEQSLASIKPRPEGQRRVVLDLAEEDSIQLPRLAKTAREMRQGPIPGSSSKESFPLDSLIIRADRATPFSHVSTIMALCGQAGVCIWRIELSAVGEDLEDAVPVPLPTDPHEPEEEELEFEEDIDPDTSSTDTIRLLANGETQFHISELAISGGHGEPSSFAFQGIDRVVIDAKPGVSFGRVLDIVRALVASGVKVTFIGPYPSAEGSR